MCLLSRASVPAIVLCVGGVRGTTKPYPHRLTVFQRRQRSVLAISNPITKWITGGSGTWEWFDWSTLAWDVQFGQGYLDLQDQLE